MPDAFGYRLKAIRLQNGLTQQDLAARLGITKQMVSQYEKGVKQPGSGVLIAVARLFQRPPGALLKPVHTSLEEVDFRKRAKLAGKNLQKVKAAILECLEPYLELEQILGIEPRFENPISDLVIQTPEATEHAAERILSVWELGLNPIPNVYEMLETHEIKVVQVDVEDSFDGLSTWVNGQIPVIVINKRMDVLRRRFTALHELGHLLLNFGTGADHGLKEKACNRFAGAMLLPGKTFKAEFGAYRTQVSFSELMAVKAHFGISMAAVVFRGKDLKIFADALTTRYWKLRSSNPDLKSENGFGSYAGEEVSFRFEQLLSKALAQEIISYSKASELSGKPLHELRKSHQLI